MGKCLRSCCPRWPWPGPVTEPGFLSSWGSSQPLQIINCLITGSFSRFPGGGLLAFAAGIPPAPPQCLAGDRPSSHPPGRTMPSGDTMAKRGSQDGWPQAPCSPGPRSSPRIPRVEGEHRCSDPPAASRGIDVTASEQRLCLIPAERQRCCQMLRLH